MFGWLTWLLGGRPASTARAEPHPRVHAEPAAVVAAANPVFGQRRPLVGRSGRVGGFEWRLPAALEHRLAARPDDTAAAAHFSALLAAAASGTQASRRALLALPGLLLASPGIVERATAGSMLLPTGPLPEPAALLALRARGALIGVPDGPPEHSPAADFVVLQAAVGGIDTLLLSAQRWHEARPHLPVVALGLESIADVERALSSGVMLAGGRMDTAGPQPPARPLHAAAHRICALLNDLAMDRETAVVAEAVRGDVALSYRLLRYANSPAIGLRQGADSVDFAVALLGRAELVRWLGVMLLSAAGGRQLSAALQEHALARGRLLEALARRAGLPRPEALFTLGLLSRLDTLVQMPLAAALEPLRLPEEARQALLRREGPWAPYLAVADELERDDEARLGALCAPFGGIDAVLAEAEQAWAWAAAVAQTGDDSTA